MSLKDAYEAANQGHVFAFASGFSPEEESAFKQQLAAIDPSRVNEILQTALKADEAAQSDQNATFEPPAPESFDSILNDKSRIAEWSATGLQAIKQGKVAVLLLAGGQGTRLGSSDPKGCYDIGLPSHQSLFQLQAERIKRVQTLAQAQQGIVWYIMTSGPTRQPTERFFQVNAFFGLDPDNVVFFEQGVLPCIDNNGKFLLDSPSSLAVAPDGNGGLYAALYKPSSPGKPSVLEHAKQRGIEFLHTYGVDNCLVRVADPSFLGYCISKKAQCGVKVVRKTDPTESVGVVAKKNGQWAVIEYSEIPMALSEARESLAPDAPLKFRAANIANHFFTLPFLESIRARESELAYHIARKKIPHLDLQTKQVVKPEKPNGLKLELFIFDVFPFVADRDMAIYEVDRGSYFSPLKNAPGAGSDCPETSRADLLAEHKRWLEAAGATVPKGVEVELAPAVSYAGEGLESVRGKTVVRSGYATALEGFFQ